MGVGVFFVFAGIEPGVAGRGDDLLHRVEVFTDDEGVVAVGWDDEVPVFHRGFEGFGNPAFDGVGEEHGLNTVGSEIGLGVFCELFAHSAFVDAGVVEEGMAEVGAQGFVLASEWGVCHGVDDPGDEPGLQPFGYPDDGKVPAAADVHAEHKSVLQLVDGPEYAGIAASVDNGVGEECCAFVDGFAAVFLIPDGGADSFPFGFEPVKALLFGCFAAIDFIDQALFGGLVYGRGVDNGIDAGGVL